MRIAPLAAAVLGGAALVVGLAAAPASAQAHHAAFTPNFHSTPQHINSHTKGHKQLIGGIHRHGYNQDGGNWSGYVATGGSYSQVSANWTEPSVTCNSSNDLYAPWVGIDGYGSSSVEQTGVATDCSSGSPNYQAWYEMYPQSPVYYNDPVNAGDSFSASVTTDGNGNYTMTITDNTAGWTETTPGSYQGQNASAEAILESPPGAYPNFGEVDFDSFTINNQVADSANPTALDASSSNGTEDHTGALSNGSFAVTYTQE